MVNDIVISWVLISDISEIVAPEIVGDGSLTEEVSSAGTYIPPWWKQRKRRVVHKESQLPLGTITTLN
jgi:hypothetical protein